MDLWQLPESLVVGGKTQPIHPDFRDVLGIIRVFGRSDLWPEGRLYLALRLFYPEYASIEPKDRKEAADAMFRFIAGGKEETGPEGPRLLDWEADADLIVSDVNRVAGREIRSLPFVHWWTFLGWFSAVGEGRLSAVVSIRKKLSEGKALEPWEKEWCRKNPQRARLKGPEDPGALLEKQRLEQMLSGRKE